VGERCSMTAQVLRDCSEAEPQMLKDVSVNNNVTPSL
jgi:hypothetical protein